MNENNNILEVVKSPSEENSASTIIVNASNQGKTGNRYKRDENGHRMLLAASKVRSVAIKCYEEQMIGGWSAVKALIEAADPKEFHIIAIRHYKDLKEDVDSPFVESHLKEHFHIIMRCADKDSTIRVRTFMQRFNICFRQGIDEGLWKKRGVETVDNFAEYTAYLTHETQKAIRDGKEPYDRSELVSNLSYEDIDEIRDGFFRLSHGKRKVSQEDMVDLDEQAYKLGYGLKSFQDWYDTLSFAERSNSKMRIVQESYERGVNKRIEEKSEVLRLCVYIKGGADSGKTYSSRKALSGYRIKTVEGGGTGKFDDLRPDHDAIIISDDTCPNLLNMCDNYICRAYKRNKNNPAWTGQYFVVTSNLEFDDWLTDCGIKKQQHFDAMRSRFFICEIREYSDGSKYLALVSPSTRGSKEEQQERAGMFMDFQQKFNASIANYRPDKDKLDFSELIDPAFLTPDRIAHSHIAYTFNVLGQFCEWFWLGDTIKTPWYREKKPNATYEDKAKFLHGLSDADIRKAADEYKDYALLRYFTDNGLRASLESFARDYDTDDFDMEPWMDPVTEEDTTEE